MRRKLRKIYLVLYPTVIVLFIIVESINFICFVLFGTGEIKNNGIVETLDREGRYTISWEGNSRSWNLYDWGLQDELNAKNNPKYIPTRSIGSPIVNDVTAYKKRFPYVYTLGEEGYVKLNYETHDIQQTEKIDEFTEEDQEVFQSLEAKKWIFDFRKSEIHDYFIFGLYVITLLVPLTFWFICLMKERKYARLKKSQMQTIKNSALPAEDDLIEIILEDHDENSDQP